MKKLKFIDIVIIVVVVLGFAFLAEGLCIQAGMTIESYAVALVFLGCVVYWMVKDLSIN